MIDCPHLVAYSRSQRHRVGSAPNHKSHGACGVLRDGQESLASLSELKTRPAHVANKSDYGQPGTVGVRVAVFEPLSDGIFTGPESAGHRIVDDHYAL